MMVLVDTSVLIDFLKGGQNRKTALLDEIIAREVPFGISAYTYQEVLQGARNEREYKRLREYLDTQIMLPAGKPGNIRKGGSALFRSAAAGSERPGINRRAYCPYGDGKQDRAVAQRPRF